MEPSHDRKCGEHLGGDIWRDPPVGAAEGHLRDLLPGSEAVVHRTAGKAFCSEPIVNAAAEVGAKVAGTAFPAVC